MKVSRLDGSRVLVVLGDSDMNDFSLDFAAMGLQDEGSRKVLLRLVSLACRKSGIDTRAKRVKVEALQMNEGCYLLVTVRHMSQRYRLKRGGGVCWRFSDCSAFLGAVEAAYRRGFCCAKNAAFFQGGVYYLIFDYPALPKALGGVLNEFGERAGGALKCAHIREHAKMICRQKALTVIGEKLV